MPLPSCRLAAALAAAFLALPAWAVQGNSWHPVAAANGDRVEIDKGRIMRTGPGKTTAWSRLVLGRELKDAAGSYTAVQAMNRYDCEARSFATVKRVYMQGARAVREETVSSPREMAAAAGSVDEKLLAEACKLRTVGEAQKLAEEAARVMPVQPEGKPTVMYADMRTAAEAPKANTLTVADKADAKPEPKAEAKPEPKPVAERPRFIDLPKIDKSQLEEAGQPQAAKGAAAKPGEAKAGEAKPADTKAKPADAKAAAKPAEKAPPVASRQALELQYATSGPRKAPALAPAPAPVARKRPAESPEPAAVEHKHIHWGYEGEGAPANWSKLRPDYATCSTGKRQSPIDIRESIRVDQEPIAFDYKPSQFRIVDNGHTIQANVGEGSSITVMGRTYQLIQLHFHRPAEERVNGRVYDMVIHMVHKDDQDHLAVVAVLLEKGAEHPVIQTLWNNLPLEVDQELAPAAVIEPGRLLPENQGYYAYMGSLTTPPCTEGVLWLVLKQPVQISGEQMAIFARLYRNNARPIQQANGRLIKESR